MYSHQNPSKFHQQLLTLQEIFEIFKILFLFRILWPKTGTVRCHLHEKLKIFYFCDLVVASEHESPVFGISTLTESQKMGYRVEEEEIRLEKHVQMLKRLLKCLKNVS